VKLIEAHGELASRPEAVDLLPSDMIWLQSTSRATAVYHNYPLYVGRKGSDWPHRRQRVERGLPNANMEMFATFRQKHD